MKVMLLEMDASEEQRQRFVREATVLAKLAHPNIVPVYDAGIDAEGQRYYTMKLVKGRTLQSVINALRHEENAALRDFTLDRLMNIFRKVCDAIAFAHSKGIIHRDLKPENIMVGEFGEVLVMDWGLAKQLGEALSGDNTEARSHGESGKQESENDDPSPSLCASVVSSRTLEGSIMGTPQYMSPEQAAGRIGEVDARSDIYSLGAILYCILTLHPPVEGRTVDELLEKLVRGDITPLTQGATTFVSSAAGRQVAKPRSECRPSSIPPALAAVTMKALSLKREARYQTVNALGAEIEAWLGGFATRAEQAGLGRQILLLVKRHKGAFGTAAAACLLLSALALWFVINVTRERNRATANEQEATHNAEIAAANEQKATENAKLARANEQRAVANEHAAKAAEAEAVAEKENVRRALAKSALALAEAAYREADGPAMQAALDQAPPTSATRTGAICSSSRIRRWRVSRSTQSSARSPRIRRSRESSP